MGRFSAVDPAQDGLNWYTYCGNNPLLFVDPLGLAREQLDRAPARNMAALKSKPKAMDNWWEQFKGDAKAFGSAFWQGMQDRSNAFWSDPSLTSGLNYIFMGIPGFNQANFDRALGSGSLYDYSNWLLSGIPDMVQGTFNPDQPLSFDHWMNSLGTATLVYGGYRGVQNVRVNAVSPYGNPSTARVGRWMSQGEYDAMVNTGRVQMSPNGQRSYVADPASINAFPAAKPGSIYVEFDVPVSSVYPAGQQGWAQVPGPGSLHDRLGSRTSSLPITEMPRATNIEIVGRK